MSIRRPHFLLFAQSRVELRDDDYCEQRRWRFVLEEVDGGTRLAAEDLEPAVHSNRLELLAVVRGLEALDGPARVTLITGSRYVSRGIRHGLNEWRRHDWRWERFGRWVPIRDHDLWRRLDRALQFHRIECRSWRLDAGERDEPMPTTSRANGGGSPGRDADRLAIGGQGPRQGRLKNPAA